MLYELGEAVPFPRRTLPALLKLQARLGDRPFITTADSTITYAEAPTLTARCAGRLAQANVGAGDRVLTLLHNGREMIELCLGTAWLGAVLVPINTAFRAEQLRHAVTIAKPTLLVIAEPLLEHMRSADVTLATGTAIWVVGDRFAPEQAIGGARICPFPPLGTPVAAHAVRPSDPAAILYTSGTSGPSKGVICPHAQFFWWGVHTGRALELTSRDVLFTVLPLFHTNALNTLWQALLNGAHFVLGARFSASRFWSEVTTVGATATYLLGTMVYILLKNPPTAGDRNHRLRIALSPATSLDLTQKFQKRFGVKLVEGYGSTETNLVLSNVIDGYRPGTMGLVVDGFEARVVDDDDCDVADGTPGELIIRHREPYSMSIGYFANPEATLSAWRNLWFHTGDRVIRDADGVYYFYDRMKDSIRRRGENISSMEVEQTLYSHPEVERIAVVGVPSELGEEDVMAFVVPRAGCDPDPVELIRFLEERLAYFAVPRYIEMVRELPETENGKVQKHLLKARGVGSNTWDRDAAGIALRHKS